MELYQHFRQYIKSIAGEKRTFLLAVSGGIDSMALLHLFRQSSLNFAIAHCNFGLRGNDSDEDEAFILNQAADAKIRIFIKRFPTAQHAADSNVSIQMAARELRYKWFLELQKENSFDFIVTAHHAGDNAETMLLNLIRGKSIASVAGIPSSKVIRPLLDVTRNEIEEYAAENKIEWREDASNATDDYDRNFLRHNVIPLLQKLNPSLEKTMRYTSVLLQEAERLLDAEFNKWKQQHVTVNAETVNVSDIGQLWTHELKHNILFRLLREYSFPAAVIRHLTEMPVPQPGSRYNSATHTLIFDRNKMSITVSDTVENDEECVIPSTGTYNLGNALLSISSSAPPLNTGEGKNVLFADAGKLKFPLIARHWKEGDYFFPTGMKGKKKLSDYFIDNKIPLIEKKNIWLLLCENEIVWVTGLRADERFKATAASKNILKITFAE